MVDELSDNGHWRMRWKTGNDIPKMPGDEPLSRKKLFSICGRLDGYYSVIGRFACSYIKRCSEGKACRDRVVARAMICLREVLQRVK